VFNSDLVYFRAWSFFNGIKWSTITKKNQVVQWSLHYKKKKESGRAMKSSCKKKESGRVPFTIPNELSQVEMELRFTIQNRNGARSSIWLHSSQHIIRRARPFLQLPAPPQHHATTPWSFFVCSMSLSPNVHIILLIKVTPPPWAPLIYTMQKKNDLPDTATAWFFIYAIQQLRDNRQHPCQLNIA